MMTSVVVRSAGQWFLGENRWIGGAIHDAKELSPDSTRGLLNAVLMKHQTSCWTGAAQLEFNRCINASVRPSCGRVWINFVKLLASDADHEVPIAIFNIKDKIRDFIAADQTSTKFRVDGQSTHVAQVIRG